MTLNFHRYYRPAPGLTGEFFEVMPLSGSRAGFLICDVTDRGVRSALVVSMLRGLVEQQGDAVGDAGRFLTGLNEGLAHLLLESGVTIRARAFYGVLDLEAGTIQFSVAGHPNPIAVFEDGVRQLVPPADAVGPALGQDERTAYGSVTAPLEGLCRMICFTEGLKEARNSKGEEFGVSRMLESIERGGRISGVMGRLAEEVMGFNDEEEFENAVCLLGWEVTR